MESSGFVVSKPHLMCVGNKCVGCESHISEFQGVIAFQTENCLQLVVTNCINLFPKKQNTDFSHVHDSAVRVRNKSVVEDQVLAVLRRTIFRLSCNEIKTTFSPVSLVLPSLRADDRPC